jgi:cyclopropane fatty-acyl-phospholipid synthase-like methyltransferase
MRPPFSEASERNRDPILAVLEQRFVAPGTVLEIGAGTGQHAVHFARHMSHLHWIATDREENHPGIAAWLREAALPNLHGPLTLDVNAANWPVDAVEYVYSANTAHIMSWQEIEKMFAGILRVLRPGGLFALYGPFNRNGQYTSDSNRGFDASLQARDSKMGLRDDQALIALGANCALSFLTDVPMPANNRVLVWERNV